MLLPEDTVAFILKTDDNISLPNFLFDIINAISLIVNGNYSKVIIHC